MEKLLEENFSVAPVENTPMVEHLSPSGLRQYFGNPFGFQMERIEKVYKLKPSPSMIIGSAAHKALEVYYQEQKENGKAMDDATKAERIKKATEAGLAYIEEVKDENVKWGKTGSREDVIKKFNQALTFYFEEEPIVNDVVGVEMAFSKVQMRDRNGVDFPIKGEARIDLLQLDSEGELEIVDFKFVTSFTDWDVVNLYKIVQGMYYARIVEMKEGVKAARVIFREIKTSKNSDGTPQVRDWVLDVSKPEYIVAFDKFYGKACRDLTSPLTEFMPNIGDLNADSELADMFLAMCYKEWTGGKIEPNKVVTQPLPAPREIQYIPSIVDTHELSTSDIIKAKFLEFGVGLSTLSSQSSMSKEGGQASRYYFKLGRGVSISKIKKCKADIEVALGVKNINIDSSEAGTIYVEVPNKERVFPKMDNSYLVKKSLQLPIGMSIDNNLVQFNLREAPHVLVAGTTGSGKSVLLSNIISTLIKQNTPDELKLILVDPKSVDLASFSDIPHIDGRIFSETKETLSILRFLCDHMEYRRKAFEEVKARDLESYNSKSKNKLPSIVCVIDEFADLIMQDRMEQKLNKKNNYNSKSRKTLIKMVINLKPEMEEVDIIQMEKDSLISILEEEDSKDISKQGVSIESLIIRLAQKARAFGIHLIIATQRPSADVITGLIKANFPTRIALACNSEVDSRIILDNGGAEKLLGKGDMLLSSPKNRDLVRVQGFSLIED